MPATESIKQIERAGKANRFDNYSIHIAVEFFKSMSSMGVKSALNSALSMVGETGHVK